MDRARRRSDVLLVVALCAFLVATLLWASLAEVELSAVAPGQIVPQGQVKTIRSFDQGKIRRIPVEEGSAVKKGEVLIEFDTTLVDAEIVKHTSELQIKAVEAARLEALLDWGGGRRFRPPPESSTDVVAINRKLLADQIAAHDARLRELEGLLAERRAQLHTLGAGIAKYEKLLPILRERTAMQERLFRNNHNSRLDLFEEQERLVELEGNLALRKQELVQPRASLTALAAQQEGTVAGFYREHRSTLAAVRERMMVLRQNIRQAQEHRTRHTLLSPVDGVVQDLAVHTESGMVEPGARLMVIVPRDAGLRVEALVSNADIGFIKPGQRVMLKVATFDFRRYGAIDGTISHIGRDAVNAGGHAGGQGAPGLMAATAQGVSTPNAPGPVFKALIDLDQTWMEIEGRKIDLLPGMSAEAAVILGQQRLIEYVLQPLRGYRQDAFREK